MEIVYGQDAGRVEGIQSELWNSNNVYALEMVEFERGSSTNMQFNSDAIFGTDIQQPLILYTPTNSLFWPLLSPEIEQPYTTNYLLPSSNEQQPRAKDKSDETEIRCWNHNCGGRRFSSMGNYRRHLREKGGNAKRHQCLDCGRFFTRSSSRNTHRQLGTCRKRKAST
jgi:hypothetical protein